MSSVVGIDVGGTKVAATLLGPNGLGAHRQQPTRLDSSAALVDQFVDLVGEAAGGEPYEAVGIGVPVFVDNDATVAALAEAHDEELKLVSRNLVMITVGTGIGGGIVIDGRIFRGGSGGAGELGMTLIGLASDPDFPQPSDRFPQPGSLESLASGHALDRFTQAAAVAEPDSQLGRLAASGRTVLGADAVAAAADADVHAAAAVRRWAHAVGIGIANAINTFDPDEVVIGGGGAHAGEALLAPASQIAAGYAHPGLQGRATIRLARFSATAGVIGAALLAAHELERVPS
jgi:glucokinase